MDCAKEVDDPVHGQVDDGDVDDTGVIIAK